MYKYTTILGGIVCVILYILLAYKSNRYNNLNNIVEAVNKEMVQYRDKYNNEVSKREIIQTNRIKDFINYQTHDSLLIELQKQVKSFKKQLKNNGSSTIYEGETNIDKSTITNVYYKDSNYIYKTDYKDKWIDYNISASKDSTNLDLKVNNKYNVTIGEERISLFKRKPFAIVTNYNPYSTITDLRTYQVTNKPRRLGIDIHLGYGINTNLDVKPQLSFGIGYRLIKL